ncbi:MAG: hypothetical protein ACYCX4_05525 [Bacillota bacterium]
MTIFGALNKGFLRKTVNQNVPLKVYTTPWKTIGAVIDFKRNEPRVLLLEKNRHIYVLHTESRFRVFDMTSGGEYEWKVRSGHLLIRRRYAEDLNIQSLPNT